MILKIYSAWTFFGGIQDIFLSCMIWFIIDKQGTPVIFRDEKHNSSYAVLEVIKENGNNRFSLNSVDQDDQLSTEDSVETQDRLVSDRMIA